MGAVKAALEEKYEFAGKCLEALKHRADARNISSADGNLTHLLVLAIIARDSLIADSRDALGAISDSFVDWNELRVTRPPKLADYLGEVTDPREKAQAIHDVLNNIFEGTHDLELGFLREATAEEARDFLTGLAGLTPAMVTEVIISAAEYFDMNADTDVARVARRLGLAGKNTRPGGFQRDIVELVGRDRGYQIMYLFKELAETTCHQRGPLCSECPLERLCPRGENGAEPD